MLAFGIYKNVIEIINLKYFLSFIQDKVLYPLSGKKLSQVDVTKCPMTIFRNSQFAVF